jgi:type VI secretion system secreted protein VgrG
LIEYASSLLPRREWSEMSQRYAGPGVGSQFLPRVGQEVLVGFLDGDIDRPIVLASLYNGQGEGGIAPTPGGEGGVEDTARLFAQAHDHRPSAQGNLAGGNAPAWHGMSGDADGHRNPGALSGFKSKEFFGSGHNRLVFDDSDGQLRLQLATTHAASELNLGHLIHQADNFRGSFRGEGFELRTDQWGAVRGQRGLWISAYGNDPEAPAGEHVSATALLKQAKQLGQAFSDIAGTHLTVKLAAHQGAARASQSVLIDDQAPLAALHASAATTVDGSDYPAAEADAPQRNTGAGTDRVPHSGDALLGLSAPAGIGLVAGQSLHWSAGETLTLASGIDSNLAAARDLRIHAGQAIGWLAGAVEGQVTAAHALALVSAEAELRLEAQNDVLKLQSKDQLKVVSANAEVELAAGKTVHLATEGGASITIEGGNISVACPGSITVHAGSMSFVGGAQLSREMNSWSASRFDERFQILHANGEPASGCRYRLTRSDGAVIEGTTDQSGMIDIQRGLPFEECVVEVLSFPEGTQ